MPELVVCSLADLNDVVSEVNPSDVISLLGDRAFPDLPGRRHLKLRFHDIEAPADGLTSAGTATIQALLAFADDWTLGRPMVIHCLLGISRSPAAALAILCGLNPGAEAEAVQALRQVAPGARPNRLMVSLADAVLGCQGRLVSAAAALGREPYRGLPGSFRLSSSLSLTAADRGAGAREA